MPQVCSVGDAGLFFVFVFDCNGANGFVPALCELAGSPSAPHPPLPLFDATKRCIVTVFCNDGWVSTRRQHSLDKKTNRTKVNNTHFLSTPPAAAAPHQNRQGGQKDR